MALQARLAMMGDVYHMAKRTHAFIHPGRTGFGRATDGTGRVTPNGKAGRGASTPVDRVVSHNIAV